MIRITAYVLIFLFQFGCAASSVRNQTLPPGSSDSRKAAPLPNETTGGIALFAAKITNILQEGWDVSRADNKIFVKRRDPVFLYNGVSLPLAATSRREMIEEIKRAAEYQITLEFADRLSEEEYRRLRNSNHETKVKFNIIEDRMRSFAGKGDYTPKTTKEKALYAEYKEALRTLPFTRLPDLYDDRFAIYIETSRGGWAKFYSPREESECRAVLENIFSFAEPYPGQNNPADYGFFTETAVSAVFHNRREYDEYLWKKELNLRPEK